MSSRFWSTKPQWFTSLASFLMGACIVLLLTYSGVDIQCLFRSTSTTNQPIRTVPRIFCMIFTTPGNYRNKGNAVRTTWAQRCTGYAFFYTPQQGAVPFEDGYALNVPEGRDHLTRKVMEALRISISRCEEMGQEIDWYLKADDDTYIIMENLRFMVGEYNPDRGLYIGGGSQDILPHGYNGGGAGYVLSRQAVKFVVSYGDVFGCALDGGFEDVEMGRCLSKFHIYPVNTKDSMNRLTFHPDHPIRLLNGDADQVPVYAYTKGNTTYGNQEGAHVLSPDTVSLHYMDPAHMFMYDFLLYDLNRHADYSYIHNYKRDRNKR